MKVLFKRSDQVVLAHFRCGAVSEYQYTRNTLCEAFIASDSPFHASDISQLDKVGLALSMKPACHGVLRV